MTPTPTGVLFGALSGQVALDGRTIHGGAQVSAEPGGHTAITDATGGYTIGSLPPGSYTVDVRKTSYLRTGERPFQVSAGQTTTLPSALLLGGDVNNDDKINITDAAIAAASFGLATGQPRFDPRADITGDGIVDIYDLVIIGNNFGCSLDDTTARCQRWGRP